MKTDNAAKPMSLLAWTMVPSLPTEMAWPTAASADPKIWTARTSESTTGHGSIRASEALQARPATRGIPSVSK